VSLSQGSTFINKQYRGLSPHLWIVISDPSFDNNSIVIVNVTSWREHVTILNDASCIIETGEHPFIDKKSYIYYRDAKLTSGNALQNALVGGVLVADEDCSPQLLEKILLGAANSQHTPIKIIRILQKQGLIE
jgi:hypothetical protein